MIYDTVKVFKAGWRSMLTPVLKKYNSAKNSSKMSPKGAHDKNHMETRVYLTRQEKTTRKYVEINKHDNVQIFQTGRGNYTDREETTSKWSQQTYRVKDIKYDATGNRKFILEGLTKPCLFQILTVSK